MGRPGLLVVFYANPAVYPPTCNAIRVLASYFDIRVVCRNVDTATVELPSDVIVEKVGRFGLTRDRPADPTLVKLREYGSFVLAVRAAFTETRPRLVLAYDPHALVAVKLARCEAPIVYQRHEVEEQNVRPRSFGDWIARVARGFSRSTAMLVFPERERAEYYRRHVPGTPAATIVPNFPLRTTFPRPSDWPALLERRWRDREIFYRGAIGPGTGVHEAVLALDHLNDTFRLRFCGFGPPDYARRLDQLAAEMGRAGQFENEGFVPAYEELNRRTYKASAGLMLYQAVSTSTRYTAAATNKIYEYAACGLPVVAPDRDGFRELLGGERWVELADENDPSSIARAIERLFASRPDYEERCHAARAAFEQRFNYETVFRPALTAMLKLAGSEPLNPTPGGSNDRALAEAQRRD